MTKTLTPKQEDFLEALLGEARGTLEQPWILLDIHGPPKLLKLWLH